MATQHQQPSSLAYTGEVDRFGRPQRLGDRLASFADALLKAGLDPSDIALRALAWWDECISPVLGTEVSPLKWRDSATGPAAPEIDAQLARWRASGDWSNVPNTPLADMVMRPSDRLREISNAIGKLPVVQGFHFTNPWSEAIALFLDGATKGVNGASSALFTRDVSSMLRLDYCYKSDPWRERGPAKAKSTSKLDDGSSVAGNGAVRALRAALMLNDQVARHPPVLREVGYAWVLGVIFARLTADSARVFGDGAFLKTKDGLVATETVEGDEVSAVFREAGNVVGRARWRPGKRWVKHTPGRHGRDVEIEDGVLLDISVVPQHAGRGIGTYIIRHAQTRGCVHVEIPAGISKPAIALISQFGWPSSDPFVWDLERVGWPLCRTLNVVANPTNQLEPQP